MWEWILSGVDRVQTVMKDISETDRIAKIYCPISSCFQADNYIVIVISTWSPTKSWGRMGRIGVTFDYQLADLSFGWCALLNT